MSENDRESKPPSMSFILKPHVLGWQGKISLEKSDYDELSEIFPKIYMAFEIELAFEFVVRNFIEIERYVSEHLILDMTGRSREVDHFRTQQWGFMQRFNSWLASISFSRDLTQNRLIKICGRGSELKEFKDEFQSRLETDFEFGLIFHLRNYSQHAGFPFTGMRKGGQWYDDWSKLEYSADYKLDYDQIRPYFVEGGQGVTARKAFGRKIESYCNGEPLELKSIARKTIASLADFMEFVRDTMKPVVEENDQRVLELLSSYQSEFPGESVTGLSIIPVDERGVLISGMNVIPVRDEFIDRRKNFEKRNGKSLGSMAKRVITNE